MNKNQFLQELSFHLKSLPYEEQKDILYDYEEHFQIGLSEGKTEEAISEALGSPKVIVKEFLVNFKFEEVKKNPSPRNITKVVLATLSLSLLNLVIVLAPLVALGAVLLSLWVVGIVFVFAPIFSIIQFQWFLFFAGIMLAGIGILICILSYRLTRIYGNICIRYAKWNAKIVKGA